MDRPDSSTSTRVSMSFVW